VYTFPLELDTHESENILDSTINVYNFVFLATFLERRSEASDYLPSTVTSTHNSLQDLLRFVEIGLLICKPAQSCIGICYYGREWLVNLLGDRARKFDGDRNGFISVNMLLMA
jgi:hypothetical protein